MRARLLFDYLSEGGTTVESDYPGVLKEIVDGSRVGLRLMNGKPPTIDLGGFAGAVVKSIELKFP